MKTIEEVLELLKKKAIRYDKTCFTNEDNPRALLIAKSKKFIVDDIIRFIEKEEL